jgi:hypothetical protein
MKFDKDKERLFSGASSFVNPSTCIQSIRSINHHLVETRSLMNESVEKIKNIKEGVANTSHNLRNTASIYNSTEGEMRKAGIFVGEIQKKEASNAFRIRASFLIFLAACAYVIFRRIFLRNLYNFW